jgi:hypothetical protein
MGSQLKRFLKEVSRTPRKARPSSKGDCEGEVEAMAEELVDRVTRLRKCLRVLPEKQDVLQKEMAEFLKWADNENQELVELKETIIKRKHSYLETLPPDDRTRLSRRHAVWITGFDMSMDQIRDLSLVYEEEGAIVRCTLEAHVLKALKIYHYAAGGLFLRIRSDRKVLISDEHDLSEYMSTMGLMENEIPSPGEFIFHQRDQRHSEWIFSGKRWGLTDHILWLDFGRDEQQAEAV